MKAFEDFARGLVHEIDNRNANLNQLNFRTWQKVITYCNY